jgi:hypothetical protein
MSRWALVVAMATGARGLFFLAIFLRRRGAVVGCAARCVAPELLGDIALRSACLVGGG